LAGGAELVNEELAKRLVQDGHKVIFLVGGYKKVESQKHAPSHDLGFARPKVESHQVRIAESDTKSKLSTFNLCLCHMKQIICKKHCPQKILSSKTKR